MRGIKLQRETEVEHGITLVCDCTLTYRVREFEEHGITSGSICTFTYHVPETEPRSVFQREFDLEQGVKLQRETGDEYGITLVCSRTFSYHAPKIGAALRFSTQVRLCARRFLRREPECVRIHVSPRLAEH